MNKSHINIPLYYDTISGKEKHLADRLTAHSEKNQVEVEENQS